MWQVAFSSSRMSLNTRPLRPTGEVPSTSATSPRRTAPGSVPTPSAAASALRSASTVDDPAVLEAEPEPLHVAPPVNEIGRVAATVPSAIRLSGVVNTSSVGMFAIIGGPSWWRTADRAMRAGPSARPQVGARPLEPEPRERTLVERLGAGVASRSMCRRQASSGSSASRRRIGAITSQSASTSSVPTIRSALRSSAPARSSSSPRHCRASHASRRSTASCLVPPARRSMSSNKSMWDRPTGRCSRRAARPAPRYSDPTTPACTRATPVGVQQPRSLHMLVPVQDAHVMGACPVRDVGDRAGERGCSMSKARTNTSWPGRRSRRRGPRVAPTRTYALQRSAT